MTLKGVYGLIAVTAVTAVMVAGAAFSEPSEEDGVETDTQARERPAIDLAAPAEIETATFGLG